MNWLLITTIVLALASPFNIALARNNNVGTTQAQFDQFKIQEVDNEVLTQIPGDPEALIIDVMPNIEYIPNHTDYDFGNPFFPNMYSSFNIIILSFNTGTRVADANSILSKLNAEILGSIPGVADIFGGQVYIRVTTVSFEELDVMIGELSLETSVMLASFDVAFPIPEPKPGDSFPAPQGLLTQPDSVLSGWTWELEPKGGDRGLEYTKVPDGE